MIGVGVPDPDDLESFRALCRSLSDERREKILAEVRRGHVVYYHLLKPSYRKEDSLRNATDPAPAPGGAR